MSKKTLGMLKEICSIEHCTACQACINICPNQCISMHQDELGCLYPQIDQSLCTGCRLCEKTCPANSELEFHTTSKVYAAWSNDNATRTGSASGGIAAELYRWALKNSIYTVGVTYSRQNGCHYIPILQEGDISKVQNSKYVYSNPKNIYKQIAQILNSEKEVLFIGLPCQVAALKQVIKPNLQKKLTCIDIVCHGVAPQEYLDQHILHIEQKKKRTADKLFFRDPHFGTNKFRFSLYSSSKRFYSKTVSSQDVYQIGYHKALIYRENCYFCKYASPFRLGDLTISDFSGLGQVTPFPYENENISCILSNTVKGSQLLEMLQEQITLEERPPAEAFSFEKQLKQPSTKHKKRSVFLQKYKREQCFEQAATIALKKDLRRNLYANITQKNRIRSFLRQLFPKRLRRWIKVLLKTK